MHLVATISEWCVAALSVTFFLTFVRSFYEIEMEIVTVLLRKKDGYHKI